MFYIKDKYDMYVQSWSRRHIIWISNKDRALKFNTHADAQEEYNKLVARHNPGLLVTYEVVKK